MPSTSLVQDYFDREAQRFDAIYEDRKSWVQRLVDRLFRGVVRQRLQIVKAVGPLPGAWTVLDVGCGSGRFSVSLASRGATRVRGIDVARQMIALAQEDANLHGVNDRCEFVTAEYLADSDDDQYDLVLALGYFDYLDEPLPHFKKMVHQCRSRLIASFPKRFDFRVPTRILRIRLSGGFVRFYSCGEVLHLLRSVGLPADRCALIDLGRDYLLIIDRT